jgi:ATP-dependent exoDNAse (exonuclease V) alpha subunit
MPLSIAYAVTIHKCQGMSLDFVVVTLGEKEFNTGLAFVAISRAKKLSGLAFSHEPTKHRLTRKISGALALRLEQARELDAAKRLGFKLPDLPLDTINYVLDRYFGV